MVGKAVYLLSLDWSGSSAVGLRDAVLEQKRTIIGLSRQVLYLQVRSRLTPAPGSHSTQWVRETGGHVGLYHMHMGELV